jgi:hypothetical protein
MASYLPIIFHNEHYSDECNCIAYVGRGMMIDSPAIVQALRKTPLVISRWVYIPESMFSYPCGKFQCDECMSWCPLSPLHNAYAIYYSSTIASQRLKCEACIQKLQANHHVTTQFLRVKTWCSDCKIIARCSMQKLIMRKVFIQWRIFIQKQREKLSIETLKPYILHWAFRPNGPLTKAIQCSFNRTKHQMLLRRNVILQEKIS